MRVVRSFSLQDEESEFVNKFFEENKEKNGWKNFSEFLRESIFNNIDN